MSEAYSRKGSGKPHLRKPRRAARRGENTADAAEGKPLAANGMPSDNRHYDGNETNVAPK